MRGRIFFRFQSTTTILKEEKSSLLLPKTRRNIRKKTPSSSSLPSSSILKKNHLINTLQPIIANVSCSPVITVCGIGGAGGNAINNMIASQLEGVEFVVANTDTQALSRSMAPKKVILGQELTRGLGAGSKPELGKMIINARGLRNIIETLKK